MARFFASAVAAVLLATTVLAAPFGGANEGGVKGPKKCHHGPPTDVPTFFPSDLPTDIFPPPSDSADAEEPSVTEIVDTIEGTEDY